jgi:hypothetical protein
MTKFRKFIYMRPSLIDNAKYNHFFVNTRIEDFLVFKVVKESDLSLRGAKTLA